MSYKCSSCDNLDNFTQVRYITDYGTELAFIEGETEDAQDYEHLDTHESECTDTESVECEMCHSTAVHIDSDEWLQLKNGITFTNWKEELEKTK